MKNWNIEAKCLLKSELMRRNISNTDLVFLLHKIGVEETKSSLDSKISRGTFSASFLLQCLKAINCTQIWIDKIENEFQNS
jgi:Domain of unknown function (DUF6471)